MNSARCFVKTSKVRGPMSSNNSVPASVRLRTCKSLSNCRAHGLALSVNFPSLSMVGSASKWWRCPNLAPRSCALFPGFFAMACAHRSLLSRNSSAQGSPPSFFQTCLLVSGLYFFSSSSPVFLQAAPRRRTRQISKSHGPAAKGQHQKLQRPLGR